MNIIIGANTTIYISVWVFIIIGIVCVFIFGTTFLMVKDMMNFINEVDELRKE